MFSNMLNRELFYTAITRARNNVSLIGTKNSVKTAVTNVNWWRD